MSTSENKFIRWFGSIATALIISSIIGLIGMYYNSGVMAEKINNNTYEIQETRNLHNADASLIRGDIKEIKTDQKVIKSDIKDILKAVK